MLEAIAVFARSELRKRPFPRIQAIALLLHLDLIGARLVGDLEQLLEQAIGALFSRARVLPGHCRDSPSTRRHALRVHLPARAPERPRSCAAEERDERAPLQRCNHSITSSAAACIVSGTARSS